MTPIEGMEFMLEHGFSVIPLDGKVPLTKHGVDDGTRDSGVITGWKRRWPQCNWGATQVGVIALDVDPRHGGSVAALKLRPEHQTLTIRTGAQGWHVFYRHSGAVRGKLQGAAGIDIKCGGRGYTVCPGGSHPTTSKAYTVHRDAPIAECPEHLLTLIVQTAFAPPSARDLPDRKSDRWDGLVQAVADAQPGNRNGMLFWAAARAAADQAPDAVYSALAAAAHEIGLGSHEISRTIQSAQQKGGAA